MGLKNGVGTILLFIVAATGLAQKPGAELQARILIGPNVFVSMHDGDFAHSETDLAVNPRNPKNLVGASIVMTNYNSWTTCKTYTSRDGGNTWRDTIFPERYDALGIDPQVAFGPDGTAYFIMLGLGKRVPKNNLLGRTIPMTIYRSEDGGAQWEKVQDEEGVDHPQIVVDQTWSNFSGRIYISGTFFGDAAGFIRSDDRGKTFLGPIPSSKRKGGTGHNMKPQIFNDGTLLLPYQAWRDKDGKEIGNAYITGFVTSPDGGVTFSDHVEVQTIPFNPWKKPASVHPVFQTPGDLRYAIDPSNNDRLYAAWADPRMGNLRIFISRSSDRGRTWSSPMLVSPGVPAQASQFHAMLAINKEGAVGLAWLDTRDSVDQSAYHVYFSASIDGGASFLSAQRVTTMPSNPSAAGNLVPYIWQMSSSTENTGFRLRSQNDRWANGGDYLGFVADGDGDFHPFWVDSRNGTAHVYSARIKVILPGARPAPALAPPAGLRKASLNGKIALAPDPVIYDSAQNELSVPIRLKNISNEILYGPFEVEVKKLEAWSLLNAPDGKPGQGAIFDYSHATRDFPSLEPGAVTDVVLWRFRYPGYEGPPTLQVEVRGFTTGK